MSYSQKYTLVHVMSPIENGALFHMSEWPLHITLADVFAIDRQATHIDTKLAALLATIKPVTTTSISESVLGTTQVVLLDKTPPLIQLHADIISLLEENGVTFNNPEFTKNGFLPHSTIQENNRLHVDDEVIINSVSLIDMFPDSDWEQRRVLSTFNMRAII